MKIQSVAVLGAGAVGSYVIWGLSEKKDISLSVIAKGERAERLKAEGCLINGKTYHPEVLTPEEAKGVDLLVVSLKYGALAGALDDIREAVGENTIVMSLMNGVDSCSDGTDFIVIKVAARSIGYTQRKTRHVKRDDHDYRRSISGKTCLCKGDVSGCALDRRRAVRKRSNLSVQGNFSFS